MAEFSNYLEEQILTHLFRTSTFTKPSTIYIAACTAAPTDTDTGSTITEPAGGSYARVQLNPLDANWTDPSAGTQGETDNAAAITFPEATGSWGTITHVAIVDAATNGNLWCYTALDASKSISATDTLEFAIGDLNIQLD